MIMKYYNSPARTLYIKFQNFQGPILFRKTTGPGKWIFFKDFQGSVVTLNSLPWANCIQRLCNCMKSPRDQVQLSSTDAKPMLLMRRNVKWDRCTATDRHACCRNCNGYIWICGLIRREETASYNSQITQWQWVSELTMFLLVLVVNFFKFCNITAAAPTCCKHWCGCHSGRRKDQASEFQWVIFCGYGQFPAMTERHSSHENLSLQRLYSPG